jgi:hypothetical protein
LNQENTTRHPTESGPPSSSRIQEIQNVSCDSIIDSIKAELVQVVIRDYKVKVIPSIITKFLDDFIPKENSPVMDTSNQSMDASDKPVQVKAESEETGSVKRPLPSFKKIKAAQESKSPSKFVSQSYKHLKKNSRMHLAESSDESSNESSSSEESEIESKMDVMEEIHTPVKGT